MERPTKGLLAMPIYSPEGQQLLEEIVQAESSALTKASRLMEVGDSKQAANVLEEYNRTRDALMARLQKFRLDK
ncbi:MAG: hypothetical protein ACYC9P_08110 [Rudaea sp.]